MRKLLTLLLLLSTSASAQSLPERMLQAEDARPVTEAGLAPLYEGLKGGGRRTAIRAIGRLERPEMIPLIAPALNDGVGIRAEAANALAQMARTPAAVVDCWPALQPTRVSIRGSRGARSRQRSAGCPTTRPRR
jgi:HEAT repeat protein